MLGRKFVMGVFSLAVIYSFLKSNQVQAETSFEACYPVVTEVVVGNGFLTGNSFRALDHDSKIGYVMGFLDAWNALGLLAGNRDTGKHPAIPNQIQFTFVDMSSEQILAMLEKYLTQNPEKWHYRMNILMWSALSPLQTDTPLVIRAPKGITIPKKFLEKPEAKESPETE